MEIVGSRLDAGISALRPRIIVRRRDYRPLCEIAIGAMLRTPRMAGGLLDELQRADVLPDAEVPEEVAGLGSWITYRDLALVPDAQAQVQLVASQDDQVRDGRISVLSSLGAALLGLRPGQSIVWDDRRGGELRLMVLAVDGVQGASSEPEGK